MTNNLFGVYNTEDDRSNYLRRSTDDQYNRNVRLGAMLNMTLLSADGNSKYQFKNIFNQLGNDRYTWREGVSAQSDTEHSAEYYYRSRTTYNGQLTGKHTFRNDELDWSASYSYANRNVPDRRRYLVNDALETGVIQLTNSNDISREWTKLDEHIASAAVNNRHCFKFGSWEPVLKFGAYGEYRTRKYTTRDFIYNWNAADNTLPDGFRQNDLSEMLSDESYFGADRLYLMEEQHMRNNYKGNNTQGAGYIAATIPAGRLSILAGLRYEYNHMELITNTRDYEESPFSHNYEYNDLFPSLNTTYKINDKHQVRFSYGKTVNRPEFREVSPSVFYDFDLASNVEGNTELKPCYIQNVDLRYEFYPSKGEVISLAAFYKHFDSPIEWTYTVAGGTNLIYSYMNAKSAKSYGLELDIRKDLSFIGLPGFSWSFNGALIKSRVERGRQTYAGTVALSHKHRNILQQRQAATERGGSLQPHRQTHNRRGTQRGNDERQRGSARARQLRDAARRDRPVRLEDVRQPLGGEVQRARPARTDCILQAVCRRALPGRQPQGSAADNKGVQARTQLRTECRIQVLKKHHKTT